MPVSRRAFMRRLLLFGGLPSAVVGTVGWLVNRRLNPNTPLSYDFPAAAGVVLPPTPECDDKDPTSSVTEGPFYKPNTPHRRVLRDRNTAGVPLQFRGRVLSQGCRPLRGAVVEVWSCDGNGIYDNAGYSLRGHQFTDGSGSFVFETVKPRDYRDFGVHRPPHLHVKVQGRGTRLLTTQVFFPGEVLNADDYFFRSDLLLTMETKASGEWVGSFDFVLRSI